MILPGADLIEAAIATTELFAPAWADPEWGDEHLYAWRSTSKQYPVKIDSPAQLEIRRAIRENKYVSIASANGMGKTADILAKTAVDFILTHYPAFVVCTSATWRTLGETLMPDIRGHIRSVRTKAGLEAVLEEPLSLAWYPLGKALDQWGIVCESPTEPEAIAGRHNRYVLFIFDEASGAKPRIIDAAHGVTLRPDDRFILSGNGLEASGKFYDSHHSQRKRWACFNLDAFDSPNVRARTIIIPSMADVGWIEEMRDIWGEDSPEWTARIRGQFPSEGQLTVISRKMVEDCVENWKRGTGNGEREIPRKGKLILGADFAESPVGDETVFILRDDAAIRGFANYRGLDRVKLEGAYKQHMREWQPDESYCDDGGLIGMSACMQDAGFKNVHGVMAGGAAHDADHYQNQRAEMTWRTRLLMLGDFAIPPALGKKLADEAGIQRKLQRSGKMLIESKGEIKERIGRSTDYFDGLGQTCVERPGDSVFITFPELKLELEPLIYRSADDREWMLKPKGLPTHTEHVVWERGGDLLRGWWIGRANPSACTLIHVDRQGAWSEFLTIEQLPSETMRDFSARVADASKSFMDERLTFSLDLMSSDDDREFSQEFIHDLVKYHRERWAGKMPVVPRWIDPLRLDGKSGVEALDKLIDGTRVKKKGEMIHFWSAAMLRALEEPRTKPEKESWGDKSEEISSPPTIKALRLLAMEWKGKANFVKGKEKLVERFRTVRR